METARFLLSRFAQSLFALFCIITLTFFLARLAPGGPFLDEKKIPEHLVEQMKRNYGFDKPLPVQYAMYLGRLIKGDLGPSFGNKGFTVNEVIAESFPVSLTLGLCGLALALTLGIPVGVFAAAKRNTIVDYALMSLVTLGICVPTFVVGPLLGEIFALKLGWFDVALWENSSAWILGSITLGLYYSTYIARLTRGSMIEVLSQDFIRTAKAKGVPPLAILFKHAFRGGITPVVAFIEEGFRLVPNPDEVADIFETPFAFLMDAANHEVHEREMPTGGRRRFYAMTHDERFIWGATAGMLRILSHRLFGAPA